MEVKVSRQARTSGHEPRENAWPLFEWYAYAGETPRNLSACYEPVITRFQNSPSDLYSQLRLLGLTYEELNKSNGCRGFEQAKRSTFREINSEHDEPFMVQLLLTFVHHGIPKHFLQDILAKTCIHRTDKGPDGEVRVDLPRKEVKILSVLLDPLERELYSLAVNDLFVHERCSRD